MSSGGFPWSVPRIGSSLTRRVRLSHNISASQSGNSQGNVRAAARLWNRLGFPCTSWTDTADAAFRASISDKWQQSDGDGVQPTEVVRHDCVRENQQQDHAADSYPGASCSAACEAR